MKIITVTHNYALSRLTFLDAEKAQKAFAEIKQAIEDYEQFKANGQKVVTVDHETGQASFVAKDITAVIIDDTVAGEETSIAYEVWCKQLEAKVAARLAPA
jgi:hypothetical protein